jgi:Flp pilus assembly pilin Flp
MRKLRNTLAACLRDEAGAEVIEYALLLGLVVVGALGLMGAMGVKVVAKWSSIADEL